MTRVELPTASALRSFAAALVAENGLSVTAREIGVRPSGLSYFLDGGAPRRATLRRLQDWYVRTVAAAPNSIPDPESLALALLLRGVPEAEREQTRKAVLVAIAHAFERARTPPPSWLRESG